MFDEFKEVMTWKFEMVDIGFMSYYLDTKVKQIKKMVFLFLKYAKETLKKFDIDMYVWSNKHNNRTWS